MVWPVLCTALALAGPVQAESNRSLLLDGETFHVFEVRQLGSDISLAYKINALNLTADQLWALSEIAYQADDARERYRVDLIPVMEKMRATSIELRRCLLEEGDASEATLRDQMRANRDYGSLQDEFVREMLALEDEIEAILDENQIHLMGEVRPCVRPPDDLSPARVGQSEGATSRLVTQLEEMRQASAPQFERRKARFIERVMVRRSERLIAGDEEQEAAHYQALSDAMDAAYEMDDLTWAVDGITAADRVDQLMKIKPVAPSGPRPHKDNELGPAAVVLLDKGAGDVLTAIYERRQREMAPAGPASSR